MMVLPLMEKCLRIVVTDNVGNSTIFETHFLKNKIQHLKTKYKFIVILFSL